MIGQTISHYRITEEIGGGGMGVVYKAEDLKLKRTVALKFLPAELTRDQDAKTRFIHEARAASALQHHNICTIHEIDETTDGQLFMSMDCYDGETLKERIARGPLPPEEAVDIAAQIATGLAKAHEAGMVHRDIKPANIIITSDNVVKILDFGLAKLAGQTKVTKTGTTLGTVSYMSPEQARGEEVDARSDVFSLGAVLYELLAGTTPFKGEHEAAVIYNIMNSAPEKLAAVRGDLSGQLQPVINRMLAKDPHKRYENCTALLADLMALKSQYPGITSTSRIMGRRTTRRSVGVIAAVIIVVAAIAFFVGTRRTSVPAIEDLSLAVVDFSTVAETEDRILSAGITNLVHVGLVESSPVRVIANSYLQDLRRRLFGSASGPIAESEALEIARKAGAAFLLTGQIGVLGEEQYVTWLLQDVKSGESLAAQQVDASRQTNLANRILQGVLPALAREAGLDTPQNPPEIGSITTDSPEAYQYYIAGIIADEEAHMEDAIKHFEKAVAYDSTFALAYYWLSRLHTRETRAGRDYAVKAWKYRSRLGVKDRMLLEAWMAWIEYKVKDAIEIDRELLERWPEDKKILRYSAERLYSNWYGEKGLPVTVRGTQLYPDDYILGMYHFFCVQSAGNLQEALSIARRSTEKHPANPDAWDCLGIAYENLGMPDSAAVMYRKALSIEADFFWAAYHYSGNDYYTGNVKKAIRNMEELAAKDRFLNFQRMILTSMSGPSLAFLYAELGQFGKSLQTIEEARRYAPNVEEEMRSIVSARHWVLLRMGHADKVYEWTKTLTADTAIPAVQLRLLVDRVRSLVGLDSLSAARTAITELRSQEDRWGGYALVIATIYEAKIALREKNPQNALDAVLKMERYSGMFRGGLYDIEYREMLAEAYRLAGRYEDAADVHREMLEFYGGHTLSHYDLGKIYEEMGRRADAVREYETFLAAWAEADEGLPQVEHARTRLAALREGA